MARPAATRTERSIDVCIVEARIVRTPRDVTEDTNDGFGKDCESSQTRRPWMLGDSRRNDALLKSAI